MDDLDRFITRRYRWTARVAFQWQRARVRGAAVVSSGTVEQTLQWLAEAPRKQVFAQLLLCPAIVRNSRTHALGFTSSGVAVVQFERSRVPPGRHLRTFDIDALVVIDKQVGPFTEVLVAGEVFQAGHTDAQWLREVAGAMRGER